MIEPSDGAADGVKIRKILKDDSEQPRFVQTVTGKGYRFVAERNAPNGDATLAASALAAAVAPVQPLATTATA